MNQPAWMTRVINENRIANMRKLNSKALDEKIQFGMFIFVVIGLIFIVRMM